MKVRFHDKQGSMNQHIV